MRRFVVALVGLALVLSSTVVHGKRKREKCDKSHSEYYNLSLDKCMECDPCGIGKDLDTSTIIRVDRHGARECYGCKVCPEGYFSLTEGYYPCIPCKKCNNLSRMEKKPCTAKQQSECGACLPGFYDHFATLSQVPDNTRNCRSCQLDPDQHPECAFSSAISTINVMTRSPMNITYKSDWSIPPEQDKAIREEGSISERGRTIGVIILLTVMAVLFGLLTVYFVTKNSRLSKQRPEGSYSCRYMTAASIYNPELGISNTKLQTEEDVPNISFGSHSAENFKGQSGNLTCLSSKAMRTLCFQWRSTGRTLTSHDVLESPSRILQPLTEDVLLDCPESFETEHEQVSSEHLEVLRDIGNQWRELARKLGLKNVDVEYLDMERYSSERERVYQMLVKWQRQYHKEATVSKAYRSLKSIGRDELAARFAHIKSQSAS